jgi:putative oxidoreductase
MSAVLSTSSSSSSLRDATELTGRILLAALFLLSGVGKIGGYAAVAGYMNAMGVPSYLLPATIVLEIVGAAAIVAGWHTRVTAGVLAAFTLAAAALFHSNFADQIQMVMFLKNVSIAGAFLLLVAHGAGRYSLDARSRR